MKRRYKVVHPKGDKEVECDPEIGSLYDHHDDPWDDVDSDIDDDLVDDVMPVFNIFDILQNNAFVEKDNDDES